MEPINFSNIESVERQDPVQTSIKKAMEQTEAPGKQGCGATRRKFESEAQMRALPPWEQTKIEEAQLRDDKSLKELLDNEEILEIQKTETGYLVRSKSHEVTVTVDYEKPTKCGPAIFSFRFCKV